MNPWIAAVLFTGAIAGGIALGAYLGHCFAKYLAKQTCQTLIGRVFCHFAFWSILTGLLMCTAMLVTNINFLVSFGLMAPMMFTLVVAMDREPPRKVCKCCGN